METSNTNIFPKGEKAPEAYFSGGTAWVQILKPIEDDLNCQIGNVTFEPGCRNNWHSHGGGQILIVTSGTGFYQEKGKPAKVLHPGDVVNILPVLFIGMEQVQTVNSRILPLTQILRTVLWNGWNL